MTFFWLVKLLDSFCFVIKQQHNILQIFTSHRFFKLQVCFCNFWLVAEYYAFVILFKLQQVSLLNIKD